MRTKAQYGLVTVVACVLASVTWSVGSPVSAQTTTTAASAGGPPRPLEIGTAQSIDTDQGQDFVFDGVAGRTIRIREERSWSLFDPSAQAVATDDSSPLLLTSTGKYVLSVGQGLRPPLTVSVEAVAPDVVIQKASVGETLTFRPAELRRQYGRVTVLGGQRYRLVADPSSNPVSFCANDETGPTTRPIACVGSDRREPRGVSFVTAVDQELDIVGSWRDGESSPDTVTARIVEAANDIVLDSTKNPVVDATPAADQSIVVPYWGTPAQRSVISSVQAADVQGWGQPWIDREEDGPTPRQKVFAVPVAFKPTAPPFVSWRSRRRIGFYRGEDAAVDVPPNGKAVAVKNVPWFAGIGSMDLAPGGIYSVQVSGANISPAALAVRDPSGKFSSNVTPWVWSEEGGTFYTAATTLSANRAGRWAVEVRFEGNAVRDFDITVTRIGGGASYERRVDVRDVLDVGDSTDIQMGPNEFAKVTVKLTSSTPQIIEPVVLRYRNQTFQPTAADLSLWDSKGRLVWSNNRNLEEEVLSGRLGKEPELTEKVATVAGAELYTLFIDPHTDLAGRFRLSLGSAAVVSDVALRGGPIPILPGGTRTGVIELRQPTRFRLTGARACLSATSLVEWGGPTSPPSSTGSTPNPTTTVPTLAPTTTRPANTSGGVTPEGFCLGGAVTLSLPPGVHRLEFLEPVTKDASLDAVEPGSPPDPVTRLRAVVDGDPVSVRKSTPPLLISFDAPSAGARVVIEASTGSNYFGLNVVILRRPDGVRVRFPGRAILEIPGTYTAYIPTADRLLDIVRIRSSPPEVVSTTLSLGAPSKVFTLDPEQRLEAQVVLTKATRLTVDSFFENGRATLLYAADRNEQRFFSGTSVEGGVFNLPAGTYRFVFVGIGTGRIRLAPVIPPKKTR